MVPIIICFGLIVIDGCGTDFHQNRLASAATTQRISISGPASVRAGQSVTLDISIQGIDTTAVSWDVNGILGGNSAVGKISQEGVYTAPAQTKQVQITASVVNVKALSSSLIVDVLNPIPQISNVSIIGSSSETITIDVQGSGFVPGSKVVFDGMPPDSSLQLSSAELQATISENAAIGKTMLTEVSNPSPGASNSNAVLLSFPPSTLHKLIGCETPNVETHTGDWGPASTIAPNYLHYTNLTPFGVAPEYETNVIFWVSRENAPGQRVLMTGAFTPNPKKAKISTIPSGALDWRSIVQASERIVATTQQKNTGLSFILPADMPQGIYGVEIEDPLAEPVYFLANVPAINWMVGVPSNQKPYAALRSSIHSCAAEPGEILRIFGKNFASSSQIVLQSNAGLQTILTPSQVDTNSLSVVIPTHLDPGHYIVWIGSSPWDATSSDASILTITAAPVWSSTNVSCSSMVSDPTIDNSPILQTCIDENAPSGSNQLIYILIPSGTFKLASTITVHPYEVIIGSSPEQTHLICTSNSPPSTWFTVLNHVGIANLSIQAPGGSPIFSTSVTDGATSASGHVFIANASFETSDVIESNAIPLVSLYGPDIQIYQSIFASSSQRDISLNFGDGALLSGNTFDHTTAVNFISASQNVIIEKNYAFSRSGPGLEQNDAFSINRPFCRWCRSMVSRNHYVGYNHFESMGRPSGEIVTLDGGGDAYAGFVASSTSHIVTLADDPSWIETGDTDPSALAIMIINGRGTGQYSRLKSYSGRDITVETPWQVIPDETSEVAIRFVVQNLTLSHNTLLDTVGWSFNIYGAMETVVEDNMLEDSGAGMKLDGTLFNTDVLRNTLKAGSKQFLLQSPNDNNGGIGLHDDQGGYLVSGMMVRGNKVTGLQTINNSNGWMGVSANVIEQNEAIWSGPGEDISGYLVKDNKHPE